VRENRRGGHFQTPEESGDPEGRGDGPAVTGVLAEIFRAERVGREVVRSGGREAAGRWSGGTGGPPFRRLRRTVPGAWKAVRRTVPARAVAV